MNEIERFLDQACRSVSGSASLRRHLREELKEHLEEAVEGFVAAGMSKDEAVQRAIEEFGEPALVREGLEAVHGRRLTALFIEKAMDWREKTMKTGWKWSFVAQFTILLVIALQVLFIAFMLVFIFPRTLEQCRSLEKTPEYLITCINLTRPFAMMMEFQIFLLLLFGGGWGLFEWKCRSENKSTIRIAAGAVLALIVTLVLVYVTAVNIIVWVQIPHWIVTGEVEKSIYQNVSEGSDAFARLTQAVEKRNWSAVDESALGLENAFRPLRYQGAAAPILAGLAGMEDISEIRRLLNEIAELSDDVHDGIRDGDSESQTLERFSKLQQFYDQLATLVEGWPKTAPE